MTQFGTNCELIRFVPPIWACPDFWGVLSSSQSQIREKKTAAC